MIIRLAIVLQLAYFALAVNFLYDETVWTKHTWPAFKLHFPYQRVLQSAPHTTGFSQVTELGPWREGSYAQHTHSTTAYDYQDTVPDEVLGLLAEIIKCRVCHTLTSSIWHLGTHWLHKTGHGMSDRELTEHMQAMCEILVPRELLKGWAVVQGEATLSGVVVQTFTLQPRKQGSSSPFEHMAVQQACHLLLSNQSTPHEEAPPLPQFLTALKKGFSTYDEKRSSLLSQQDAEAVPSVHGEAASCYDKHEKCPFWASIGECEKNGEYMVEAHTLDGVAVPGHCQLSCATCTLQVPSGLSTESDRALKAFGKRIQAETVKAACNATGSCPLPKTPGSTDGAPSPSPAAAPASAASGDTPRQGQQQQVPTRIMAQEGLQVGIGPLEPGGSRRSIESVTAGWSKHPLGQLIGQQCLFINLGWWSYEVCCLSHINQYHTEKNQLQAAHSLGVYDEDTSALLGAGASMMLDSEDLLPGMKMTKAVVTQYYANGAECQVTEFNEVYHSWDEPTMLRSTELRLACSPDTAAHMVIREPAQCLYIITVYLPGLCHATQAAALNEPITTEGNENFEEL
ncbi:hypothetical protein ABBQ38_000492 [Trebouxia sp. C0009 RCD-2024]